MHLQELRQSAGGDMVLDWNPPPLADEPLTSGTQPPGDDKGTGTGCRFCNAHSDAVLAVALAMLLTAGCGLLALHWCRRKSADQVRIMLAHCSTLHPGTWVQTAVAQ